MCVSSSFIVRLRYWKSNWSEVPTRWQSTTSESNYRKNKRLQTKVESVSLQVGMPTDDLGQTHCYLIEKYMISYLSEYYLIF